MSIRGGISDLTSGLNRQRHARIGEGQNAESDILRDVASSREAEARRKRQKGDGSLDVEDL
jgi:hypothetical protein